MPTKEASASDLLDSLLGHGIEITTTANKLRSWVEEVSPQRVEALARISDQLESCARQLRSLLLQLQEQEKPAAGVITGVTE